MTNGQPMQFTKYWHSAITARLASNKSSNGVLQSLESVDIADEQRGSPYDAKCNVAEIGAVNMGEIGAVRKRSR